MDIKKEIEQNYFLRNCSSFQKEEIEKLYKSIIDINKTTCNCCKKEIATICDNCNTDMCVSASGHN